MKILIYDYCKICDCRLRNVVGLFACCANKKVHYACAEAWIGEMGNCFFCEKASPELKSVRLPQSQHRLIVRVVEYNGPSSTMDGRAGEVLREMPLVDLTNSPGGESEENLVHGRSEEAQAGAQKKRGVRPG